MNKKFYIVFIFLITLQSCENLVNLFVHGLASKNVCPELSLFQSLSSWILVSSDYKESRSP